MCNKLNILIQLNDSAYQNACHIVTSPIFKIPISDSLTLGPCASPLHQFHIVLSI